MDGVLTQLNNKIKYTGMMRKMVFIGGAYITGLFFASCFSEKFQIAAILIILLLSLIICGIKNVPFKFWIVCAVPFILSFSAYQFYTFQYHDKITAYSGSEINYTGKIITAEQKKGGKISCVFDGKINSKINAKIIYFGDNPGFDYGDEVTFTCTPSVFNNDFLFKSEDYYDSSGIFLGTYSLSDLSLKKNEKFSPVKYIVHYRDYIKGRIERIIPGDYGALIAAMLTGDRSSLEDSAETALYRSGTGHMMAVSGIHLVILTSFVMSIMKKSRLSGLIRFSAAAMLMLLFIVFSGMSVSVIRAALMLLLVYGAEIFVRRTDTLNSVCIAALIITLPNPYIIKSTAFLLSFSGVTGAGVFAPYITKNMKEDDILSAFVKKLTELFCISVSMFPVSVICFDEVSLAAPFSNILLMPLCTFILACGFITALTGGISFFAYPVLIAGGLAAKFVIKISEFISSLRFSVFPLGAEYVAGSTLIISAFVIITILFFRDRRSAVISLAISAVVFAGSTIFYNDLLDKTISVYRIGSGKSSALAVVHGRTADIIDLTGGNKDAAYISKLIKREGRGNINSVIFLKNSYRTTASYNAELISEHINNIFVPEDMYISSETTICGCFPQKYTSQSFSLEYEDYNIDISDSSQVNISYGDTIIKCDKESISIINKDREKVFSENNTLVRIDLSGQYIDYKLK